MANEAKNAVKLAAVPPAARVAEQLARETSAEAHSATALGHNMAQATAQAAGATAGKAAETVREATRDASQASAKTTEQAARAFEAFRLPGLPTVETLMEGHRRNLEALGAAGRAIMDGAQAVARRNAELAQRGFQRVGDAMRHSTSAELPQARLAAQAEAVKRAYEENLADLREVQAIVVRANEAAAEAINTRFLAAMDEVKATAEAAQSHARPV